MRVLRVITRLNIGGPGLHVLSLARATPDIPSLLAAGRPDAGEGELEASGLAVARVPLVRPISPAADARAILAIRRLIVSSRPAVVESHMAKAGMAARAAGASLRSRPALVHVFHGHVFDGYFSPGVVKVFVAAERFLAARSDLLITVSPQTRDRLLSMGIGRPEQYRVVPLGLDLAPFLAQSGSAGAVRSKLGIGAGVPLIGVAARLVPIKDHATLLVAVGRLNGAHLAVFGDGVLRRELEEKARSMGLEKRIHFLGWWGDMAAGLADCDVVALSSLNEGTPVSLIEAMAAARPVVATQVGGNASVVEEGASGFLVPAGDSAAMAERLETVLSDRALAARLGARGRDLAQERFQLARLVKDMRDIYLELSAG